MDAMRQALTEGLDIIWIITKDFTGDDQVYVSNAPKEAQAEYRDLLVNRFRIYDDDGELYYEGLSTDQSSEVAFEPLDWAMQNAGATEIKYKSLETRKWETL